ncbi:hypothetical protein ACFV2N_26415, partial [Streptomyces sp. NPDC059680]
MNRQATHPNSRRTPAEHSATGGGERGGRGEHGEDPAPRPGAARRRDGATATTDTGSNGPPDARAAGKNTTAPAHTTANFRLTGSSAAARRTPAGAD